MKTITFLTLFISLILGACGDKRRLEMQPYAVQTLKDNLEALHYRAKVLQDSIRNELEIGFNRYEIWEFLMNFEARFDSLSQQLAGMKEPNLELTWRVYIAGWKTQALAFHQYFSDLISTDTIGIIQRLPATFKQNIDDFPPVLDQMEQELLANPQAKNYWFRYTQLVFYLWRADLYQSILRDIVPKEDENYVFLVSSNYYTLPRVGEPHSVLAFVTTNNSTNKAFVGVDVFGKFYPSTELGQVMFKAYPKQVGNWRIPLSFIFKNRFTGEKMTIYREFAPFVHQ